MDIGKIAFAPALSQNLAEQISASAKAVYKLIAERDTAQRELTAYKQAIIDWREYGFGSCKNDGATVDWIERRARELMTANA